MTTTSVLTLHTAIGSYGHHAALKDGSLKLDRIGFNFEDVTPITTAFRRMCRSLDFDISEMAITTYLTAKAYGKAFTAIPIFPVRGFAHNAAVGNTKAGVNGPKDLEGKKAGVRAYTVTTGVWARGILASEYGVDLNKVTWVLADEEHVDDFHKDAPPNAQYQLGADLGKMLAEGELAAGIGVGRVESPDVKPVIPNAGAAAKAYYNDKGIYPINHTVVVKNELLEAHPWLAAALFEAFKEAKEKWLASASDEDKKKVGADFIEGDPLPIGIANNRKALETIAGFAYDQKITKQRYTPEDMFAKGTLDLS
jgi:4,5-dihydroxyphthalate decarboxylase